MTTVLDSEGLREGPWWRMEVAAIFERTSRAAGIGWRLRSPGGTGELRARTLRSGRTLVYAELSAVHAGLLEARRLHADRLEVKVPGRLSVRLLRGGREIHARRAAITADRVRVLFDSFESVRIVQAPVTDPDLSRAVGEALDAGRLALAAREDQRTRIIEEVVRRSRGVRLEERNGTWVANGRYRVSLDPLHCDCPAWTARWARAPIAGRRAQRLLCKHLVALAIREGFKTPEELSELARRAPG